MAIKPFLNHFEDFFCHIPKKEASLVNFISMLTFKNILSTLFHNTFQLYHMLSFKNQWHVILVKTFYNINLIKSVNECHVPLIFKR